ncbi:MAG: prepilin-type N-terminal cleavage/methylation domain-containing protein [Opitutaceae bacterium]|nr:prepilin-type N-terminal cleavage/methylation domain-containing protein [Opitutaceae bacterium]
MRGLIPRNSCHAESRRSSAGAKAGFSLLEVVVAVGIFALAMTGILGLFAPVARTVGDSADADRAARVADALRLKLRAMPFDDVKLLLKTGTASGHPLTQADARSDYQLSTDTQLLFASRDGTKLGPYNDPVWIDPATRRNSDREKFFEIALVRNEVLSPPDSTTTDASGATVTVSPDATAPFLAYTARFRWPAYVSDGTSTGTVQFGANPAGTVRFDHGKKSVLFFPGTVAR